MGTSFGHRSKSKQPSAMRTVVALLAFATVATCAPSSSSSYASAYSYQNIVRKGKDSYDMEYAVKGTDYKGEPLDFNAREGKYGYDTEGECYAVLPQGYVCVCYAVGESAALKCDCGPNPPTTHAPPPSPPKCPYGTSRDPYTGECERTTPRPTQKPKPKMVKLVYETYVPEYLANHPELLSINHQHSHDDHHPTLSLKR